MIVPMCDTTDAPWVTAGLTERDQAGDAAWYPMLQPLRLHGWTAPDHATWQRMALLRLQWVTAHPARYPAGEPPRP